MPFPVNTATEDEKQYHPDFTIYFQNGGNNYYVILEHFGIDSEGKVPSWFGLGQEGGFESANKRYNEGIHWKREINRKYNIPLLETASAMFHDGTVYDKLSALCIEFP